MDDSEEALQPARLLLYDAQTSDWITFTPEETSDRTSLKTTLKVATWNVWLDDEDVDVRHPAILETLFSGGQDFDLIALQEVTTELFHNILAHPVARSTFVVTDLTQQFELTQNYYSTVILVRRGLAEGLLAIWFEFQNTHMGRGLNVMELIRAGKPFLRFATSHFESHPEDLRKRQNQYLDSAHLLSLPSISPDSLPTYSSITRQPIPSLLAGDFNPTSYSEVERVLQHPASYSDAYLLARPLSNADPFYTYPTFGVALPYPIKAKRGKYNASRLDYILIKDLGVRKDTNGTDSGLLGVDPIKEQPKMVWMSDHLGVWVTIDVPLHSKNI